MGGAQLCSLIPEGCCGRLAIAPQSERHQETCICINCSAVYQRASDSTKADVKGKQVQGKDDVAEDILSQGTCKLWCETCCVVRQQATLIHISNGSSLLGYVSFCLQSGEEAPSFAASKPGEGCQL